MSDPGTFVAQGIPPHGNLDDREDNQTDILRSPRLSQQVAEILRNDIVHGTMRAGTRLVQDRLCERFGTSRMPIREALQQLTQEGIVERQGSHLVVASLGVDDLEEVHELTALLHGWAARRAAARASQEELTELGQLSAAALGATDPYEWARRAMDVHRKINVLAKSQRLMLILRGLEKTAPRTHPFNDPEVIDTSKVLQSRMWKAIQSRDEQESERLTRDHMMKVWAILRSHLEDRQT